MAVEYVVIPTEIHRALALTQYKSELVRERDRHEFIHRFGTKAYLDLPAYPGAPTPAKKRKKAVTV